MDMLIYGGGVDINLDKRSAGRIVMEKDVTLVSDSKYNPAGINHPCILTVLGDAEIYIGEGSGMSGATLNSRKRIYIGKHVGIGANVIIYDNDFHSLDPFERIHKGDGKVKSAEVYIDDYAWIGGNSIILKGVRIGRAAVIGAGSVVTSDVPPYTIYAGNPAKFIRKLPDSEI